MPRPSARAGAPRNVTSVGQVRLLRELMAGIGSSHSDFVSAILPQMRYETHSPQPVEESRSAKTTSTGW